ncbi:sigma-70 family RNA polymerase sigma factor [Verrucomicrobiaceae bacterium 227]
MKNSTDAHLVTAAQAGEKAAFVDLVARYQGMVTGITLSILRDFQASEDAAQETFITAWKKMSEIHHPEKLRPWLAQIARNAALMALRKTRPLPPLETFPGASEIPRPDELIVQKEEAQIVVNALAELPEKLRLPLILFYRDDQSVRNVSEALSLTPDIVKKRLSEGRALLRRRVAQLLDPVIRATAPGVLFTTAVAATIGALMPPSAIAATALSTTQKTATLTAVTTSKISLAATVLTLGHCLPGGYFLHQSLNSHTLVEISPPPTSQVFPIFQRTHTNSQNSPLLAQWQALKARHLNNGPAGFPDLLQEITALHWFNLDPRHCLQTLLGNRNAPTFPSQFLFYPLSEQWLAQDFTGFISAIDALPLQDRKWNTFQDIFCSISEADYQVGFRLLREAEMNFLSTSPPQIKELAAENPKEIAATIRQESSGYALTDGLSQVAIVWAKTDPEEALAYALAIPGKNGTSMSTAALTSWTTHDPEAAAAWLAAQPNARIQDELRPALLKAWQQNDPESAHQYCLTKLTGFRHRQALRLLKKEQTK